MKNSINFLAKTFYNLTKRYPAINSVLRRMGWKNDLLNQSEVFCMAPWLQIHAQTNGNVAPCCMADSSGGKKTGNLNTNANLSEQWNSPKMMELRKNMLEGKKSPICGNCYKYESLGKVSERMTYNRDYPRSVSRLLMTDELGYLHEQNIPIIDLRFSNKCNYKCRICNSEYSTLWYEEELKVGNPYGNAPVKEKIITDNQEELWHSLSEQLPGLKRIHFAGGEPLFMDEHYKVLENLIEVGNTDAILSYNTNFSTLRYKKYDVVEMWQKFKTVDVWASLDGMGEKGDYQRKGQRWSRIEENIREVQKKCTNVLFGVNVTVSIFNIFDICEFYRYMVENKIAEPDRMNLYLLFGPECFSITELTPELKNQAAARIDNFIEKVLPTIPKSNNFKNHLLSIRSYLYAQEPQHQKVLKERIQKVDALREEKFESVFPELASLVS